jgi:membrane dipeptidase
MTFSRREMLTILAGAGASTLIGGRSAVADPRWYDPAATPLGMTLSEAQQDAGIRLLGRHPSVDVHCHPGRFFLRGVTNPTPRITAYGEPFEDRVVAEMRFGQLSGGLFAGVADMSLLEFSPDRGLYATREFRPGEAWADYRRQVSTLRNMVAQRQAAPGRDVGDVIRAHRRHQTAAIFSIEGGDFIEDRLDRVHQAYADGVRSITIVHYHVNQIGDIQTAPAHHDRLTETGAAIVREMNRAGIIVDLAHAPLSVVRGAADVSTRPMMISHTNLSTPSFNHPRLVSPELARLVTRNGGIVGSVPSGIGQTNFAAWIDSIMRLVDTVGVDHVAIGTDMDSNYLPVFTSYRQWHLIPSALLARGMHEREVAMVLGANFLRVFAANRP